MKPVFAFQATPWQSSLSFGGLACQGEALARERSLVEAAGIEPASEDSTGEATTCVSCLLNLAPEPPTGGIFRNQAI